MFESFFYHLRAGGLAVSSNEWLTFCQAMDMGLTQSDPLTFYRLGRMILLKSEKEFDRYDSLFSEWFGSLESMPDIPPEFILEWLKNVQGEIAPENRAKQDPISLKKLYERMENISRVQEEQHDGGEIWIGAGGESLIGHSGVAESGLRVEGRGMNHRALAVAGRRSFKDFRENTVLTRRDFSMALRKLRQMSVQDSRDDEVDVDETVNATGKNGGLLTICRRKNRKNSVKVLLLMDVGGSMRSYSRLCSDLFHAAVKEGKFQACKVYYFHNCVYDELYTEPTCGWDKTVSTEWVMNQISPDYRLILVGDGSMGPTELFDVGGNYNGRFNAVPGVEWLARLKKRYSHHVWLNPSQRIVLGDTFWEETMLYLGRMFPTFPLTLKGLEDAMKKLLQQEA